MPLPDRQVIFSTLSTNQLFASPLPQHHFHLVQAIDSGAHLRFISVGHSLSIRHRAPKIHLDLALLSGDDGLNDRRGLLRGDVRLP
jgi:hypothetical protein